MKKLIKKFWRISTLKYLAAFLIPLIFVMMMNCKLDNDSWYVLAEGKYIAEKGIYYEDVLSMHEGLNVVVQNYGFAVIFYWIFTIFGAPGIYVTMLLLNLLICYLLYKICILISDKNVNLSLLIMMITDFALALSFVVTRAQMVSFVIFLALIYILELYIKKKSIKYLFLIPILSLIQINVHASLWLMLFLVISVYIIDSINKPEFKLQGYKTWPLIVFGGIGALVGLINPYGLRMISFILSSYSNAVLKDLVVELRSFSPLASIPEAIIYICIIMVGVLFIFAKHKNIRVRYILMFFGFLALGLNTVKGLSQFILVMFFPLAYLCKNARIEKIFDAKIARNSVMIWCGGISVFLCAILVPVVSLSIKPYPDENLVAAVDSIDNDLDGREKSAYTIYTVYTGYNTGGYLEYRGYKPYIDPRGEYFIEKINGKEDILKEYSDFRNGIIKTNKMLEKYDFDYLFISGKKDPFYELRDERYQVIYSSEEYETKVYKKI